MLFGNSKGQSSELTINGNVIEKVHKTKFLGAIIDDKLKWNDQINQFKSKLSKTISVLYIHVQGFKMFNRFNGSMMIRSRLNRMSRRI